MFGRKQAINVAKESDLKNKYDVNKVFIITTIDFKCQLNNKIMLVQLSIKLFSIVVFYKISLKDIYDFKCKNCDDII